MRIAAVLTVALGVGASALRDCGADDEYAGCACEHTGCNFTATGQGSPFAVKVHHHAQGGWSKGTQHKCQVSAPAAPPFAFSSAIFEW